MIWRYLYKLFADEYLCSLALFLRRASASKFVSFVSHLLKCGTKLYLAAQQMSIFADVANTKT